MILQKKNKLRVPNYTIWTCGYSHNTQNTLKSHLIPSVTHSLQQPEKKSHKQNTNLLRPFPYKYISISRTMWNDLFAKFGASLGNENRSNNNNIHHHHTTLKSLRVWGGVLCVCMLWNQQLQLSRPNSASAAAISERTLEECWSTLQRVSWHLFRCV